MEGGLGTCHFDPAEHFAARQSRRMDRFSQLAMIAAKEAITQAGLQSSSDAACIIGTAIGGLDTIERQLREHGTGPEAQVSPLAVPMLMANAAAAQIAMSWKLHGPSYAVVSACAAGAQAIVEGARLLRSGEAPAAVVGGSEAANSTFTQAMFSSAGAISPTGQSRPFHAQRDGFVLAEGAGVLVLETEDSMKSRGGNAIAELLSWGTTTDAYHLTAPNPYATQAAAALKTMLASGQIRPDEVGYINAHGTGTALNDTTEATALRQAFGKHASSIPISSTKSVLGHLLGAAGSVEAIITLLAASRRQIPPTAGLNDVDPRLRDLNLIRRSESMRAGARVTVTNSMGFGGHNVALAFAPTP